MSANPSQGNTSREIKDESLSSRYYKIHREESDSEVSEADENRLHFSVRERTLKDWSDSALENKYIQYKREIDEHSDKAIKALNVLEKFCNDTKSKLILSAKSDAADLESDANISDEQLAYNREKIQELDINYTKPYEESVSRVKRSFKIMDELKKRNSNASVFERDINNQMDKLADLDRKYSLEVFKTQRTN